MYEKLKESEGNLLAFVIGERLSREQMDEISADVEKTAEKHGKVRLLLIIEGYRHMDPGALLDRLKFIEIYTNVIERVAVVSNRVWIKSWVNIGGLFTPETEVEYFDQREMQQARRWVRGGARN